MQRDPLAATRASVLAWASATPGFFPAEEAEALHATARRAVLDGRGPLLEIGAYLGRSSLYLAAACCEVPHGRDAVLFSVDHHRGSLEMQAGSDHHDPALVDAQSGQIDSLPFWRTAIADAGVEDKVVAVIGTSSTVAHHWQTRLGLVLIDGGHGAEIAWADYRGWAPKVAVGGFLVIHDVFANPHDGGRPPYECYRAALDSEEFVEDTAGVGSLRVLVRVGEPASTPKTAHDAAPPRSTSVASTTAAAE